MLKRFLSFYILIVCYGNAVSQSDTLRLFYGINEFQSDRNNKRMDSLLDALNGKFIKVKINGYADFLSGNAYNQSLSQKRVDAVKNYFSSKAAPSQINSLSVRALGEKNSRHNNSPEGEPFQRRVDLIFEPLILSQSNDQKTLKDTVADTNKNSKKIENLEKGESLAIEGLNFIPGRHFLVKEALPLLDELLKTLKENPSLKIEIQGHICCVIGEEDGMDTDTHEKKLSLNRARTVYNFLVKNGIDPERLTYKGYGRSHPKISPEMTEADEQANRRVEIKILEK